MYESKFKSNINIYSNIVFITLYSIYKFSFKYSRYPELSIFLYLTLGLFYTSFAVIRQFLALSIILFSIKYILDRNFLKYLIVIILASSFHKTSIFMIIIYFINPKSLFKNKYYILIFSIISSMFSMKIVTIMIEILSMLGIDYSSYLYKSYLNHGSNLMHVLVQGIIVFWLLIFYKYIKDYIDRENKITNIISLSYVCISISLIIMIFSSKIDLISRINLYFSLFNIITIPYVLKFFRPKSRYIVILLIIIELLIYTYFILKFRTTNIIVPYQSIFIK